MSQFQKLTPVLLVDSIPPCLPFWTERLGFTQVAGVPGPDGLPQFVILAGDGIEVMYQTWAALEEESHAAAATPRGHSIALFLEIIDLDRIDHALAGIPRLAEHELRARAIEA